MEALIEIVDDIREQENGSMVFLASHMGVIYCVDLESGEIKWHYDTKKPIYQVYQAHGVAEYVDIGGEDEYPYYCSRSPATVIPGKTIEDMGKQIKYLSKEDPFITKNGEVYHLNCSTGSRDMKDGRDTLLITRTDWNISMDSRWSLKYSNLYVLFPCSETRKCLLLYARTPCKFIEICHKFGLVNVPGGDILSRIYNLSKRIRLKYPEKEFVENKGNTSYLHGFHEDDEAFIRRVPIMDEPLKVIRAYKKLCHSEYVVRLLSVERDDEYAYLAFEKFRGCNLAAFIENTIEPVNNTSVLRHVVRALLDLHASNVLHCNITAEHVLLRVSDYGDCIVKLCGLGSNMPLDMDVCSPYYMLERHKLAELILKFMTSGSNKCARTETPIDGAQSEDEMKEAGPITQDLVKKLKDPNYMINLKTVYNHVIFWDWYEQISFLKDSSDAIFAGSLTGIEQVAGNVFDGDWESKIEEDEEATKWFAKMKEVPEETAKMKERAGQGTAGQGTAGQGTAGRGRAGRGRAGRGRARQGRAKRPVFDTTQLRDLLRLIRNSYNHPCKFYPGLNKHTLWEYVTDTFPALLIEIYNLVMTHGEETQVYKDYFEDK